MTRSAINARIAFLCGIVAAVIFTLIVVQIRQQDRAAAQATGPYYTQAEAVGFVRGWLSEQRSLSPTNIGNCLAILERNRPAWASRWAADHWTVEATIPGSPTPRAYQWWERTWAVENPNSDC